MLAAEYDAFTGDYPYVNKALFPPREVPRTGAESTRRFVYGSLALTSTRSQWHLKTWYSDAERGLPAIHATLPGQEKQWDKHIRTWLHGSHRFIWGTIRASGLVQTEALRYRNGRTGLDNTGRTLISTAVAEATFTTKLWGQLGAGLEGGYERASHPRLDNKASGRHGALFAHGVSTFRRLRLHAALRQDLYLRSDTGPLTAASPRVGVNVHVMRGIYVKASLGRAFKIPSLNDRFWQPGGSPLLRPEHSWTAEAGLRAAAPATSAELTTFHSHNRDEIVWAPTEAGYWVPDNINERTLRGVELAVAADAGSEQRASATAGAHYTYTTAGGNTQMRLIPRNSAKAYLTLRLGKKAYRATFNTSIRYTGAQEVSSEDSIQAFTVIDNTLRLLLRVQEHTLALSLVAENTLGTHYEWLPAHPMPPRLLRLDLTLTL